MKIIMSNVKYIVRVLGFLAVMNLMMLMLCYITGATYEPSLFMNLVVPVLCAMTSIGAEKIMLNAAY